MAGLHFYYKSPEVTLETAAGWNTLFLIQAPAVADGIRFRVAKWGGLIRGQTNSQLHVLFRVIRCSDTGTGGTTEAASAIAKLNTVVPESFKGTIIRGTFSAQPTTSGAPLREFPFHPQAPQEFPVLERGELEIGGGEILAIQYNNDAGNTSVKASGEITVEQ